MGILTLAAGYTFRSDLLFTGSSGPTPSEFETYSDGTAAHVVYDASTTPPTPIYMIASNGPVFTPPNGQPIYPIDGTGNYALGDVTADFTLYDLTSGSPVVIGTLTGHVWRDVHLAEFPGPGGEGFSYRLDLTPETLGGTFPFLMGDDTVTLGNGNDVFNDYGGNLTASLGSGDDMAYLFEGPEAQTVKWVDAGGGHDQIYYQDGAGTLLGGNGNDTIGTAGGSSFAYVIDGGRGSDIIEALGTSRIVDRAGSGNDQYSGSAILSYATGTEGITVDFIAGLAGGGTHGQDTISLIRDVEGSRGNDAMGTDLEVNLGSLRLWGLAGNDTLNGALQDDLLDGGKGNDVLTGGTGRDTLAGGAGADTFVYRATGDSTVAKSGRDRLQDFAAAEDVIDLSAIDANANTAADDSFAFIGTGAFTARGQVRYEQLDGNTVVWVNSTGNLGADMRIDIAGLLDLTLTDFVL